MYVRTYGRSHDHVITKISRIDGLPHFLINGVPRARSSAIKQKAETLQKLASLSWQHETQNIIVFVIIHDNELHDGGFFC